MEIIVRNIKITVGFDGSKYKGWQRLREEPKTIQGTIEQVLSTILKEEIQVVGCGRTDAGVHAIQYVLNFFTKSSMDLTDLKFHFEKQISKDIQLYDMQLCDDRFHSRYQCLSKTYVYKIDNREHVNLFTRAYYEYIQEPLDLNNMKTVSSVLVGEHDFQSFTTLKTKNKSTVRTIKDICIEEQNGEILIHITADGFLWNMVRIIVGTLIEAGKGRIDDEDVKYILDQRKRQEAPGKVSAKALYLEHVEY